MVTKTGFLLARFDEDEAEARSQLRHAQENEVACKDPRLLGRHIPGWWQWPEVQALATKAIADCEAKRQIVRLHEQWPVLVETQPEFTAVDTGDIDRLAIRVSRQIAWLTEQEYRQRFGVEPPTTPMIAALLSAYVDHPNFEAHW